MSSIYIFLFSFIECIILSSGFYLYLNKKTGISLKYLLVDNILVIVLSTSLTFFLIIFVRLIYIYFFNIIIILFISFIFFIIRFYRTPIRKINAEYNDIISPSDGNIIYIKKLTAGKMPVSIKGKSLAKLNELTKTDILKIPCWLIGINMTIFDVHKNCAPISGEVILNQHFNGKFISLKLADSEIENERHTIVIQKGDLMVGVVLIASRLVRRIDTYIKEGEHVQMGDWIGMIRFGSQVDILIPQYYNLTINVKDQVYARETIIARLES